jgi:hypothetical protein
MNPIQRFVTATEKVAVRSAFLLFAALAVIAILSGCGDDEVEDPGDAQLGAVEAQHTLTVNQVIHPLKPEDTLPVPEPGTHYALVDITVSNESSQELIFSPADLQLETDDGSLFSYDFDFEGEEALAAVNTISPGGELSGAVAFEIPMSLTPEKLIDLIGGNLTRIDLPQAYQSSVMRR